MLHLNWFSPLPPAATDIANYTARVLPALARRARVTVWTQQAEWDSALAAHAEIRRWDADAPDWPALNRADATFYQIGNNSAFHGWILALARARPGIVVLHDRVLQHMAWEGLGPQGYRAAMAECHGAAGIEAADRMIRGETDPTALADAFPLTGLALGGVLGGALAVVTHSETTAAWVRAQPLAPPVVTLALPYRLPSSSEAVGERNLPSSSEAVGERETPSSSEAVGEKIHLIQFGFIGPNRRLEAIFTALAGLPAAARARLRLSIYGRIWGRSALLAEIARHGLDEIVTVHGFIDEPALDAAIAAADLGCNLRWPSMGEASGSQLRYWFHGKPALATATGWYAEQPAGTLCPVDPAQEVADIQAHLRRILDDPAQYRAIGAAGRARLIARHAPEAYADGLVAALSARPAWWRRQAGLALSTRLGARLAAAPPALTAHPGIDRLAARIAAGL